MTAKFEKALNIVKTTSPIELRGRVTDVRGIVVEATGPRLPVGYHVVIMSGNYNLPAQVVGFKKDRVLLMPYSEVQGVAPGSVVRAAGKEEEVIVSNNLLGRIVNALGKPLDSKPLTNTGDVVPLFREPPNPVLRKRIDTRFDVGIKAINGLLTIALGQRIGIMAGSGVGKSTLLGMIARHCESDVNVIALVGERGREVREFIERDLGQEGLKRSIVVVSTGNESALLRIRAAFFATSIAEYFRDQGKKVVLMLDSITRLAMAQREIGLAIGEPPSSRGYTPSVFSMLPRLLERTGTTVGEGAITAFYTVLVEGDDMNEPIADATRGILDGHIVLNRRLAGKGHYPAIEILESVSRVMPDIVSEEHLALAAAARDVIASYRENEDLITIGAYKEGQNPRVDRAVRLINKVTSFLVQKPDEKYSFNETFSLLKAIFAEDNAALTEQQEIQGVM